MQEARRSLPTRSSFATAGNALLIFVFLIAELPPFAVNYIADSLDPSWVQASVYALLHKLAYGRDFVFTSGPLSPIYTGQFSENYTLPVSLVRLLTVGFLAVAIARTLAPLSTPQGRPRFFLLAATILVLIYATSRDSLLMIVPVLTALLYANRIGGPVMVSLGIALSAAASLAKFSVFPLAIGAFVLIDFLSVARRNWPYKTVCMLLAASLLFAATGQDFTDFPAYILANIEVSSGYSEAMGVNALPWGEPLLIAWLALAVLLVVLVVIDERRMCKLGISDLPTGMVRSLLLAGFLFVLAKSAFVRYDLHALIGWSGLALAGLVFQRSAPTSSAAGRLLVAGMACIAITATAASVTTAAVTYQSLSPLNPVPAFQASRSQLKEGIKLATAPRSWLDEKYAQSRQATELIATSVNLPALAGTVDIIPSRQSQVIAAGLDYRPRPVIQEYATYSEALIARNRRFFASEDAPDYLLFGPGSIDNRYPASAEGSLWPLFLQRYQTIDFAGDMLVMRKRNAPLPSLLGVAETGRAPVGDWYGLPAGNDVLFVKIDVRPNLLGKLLDFVFKPPQVKLTLAFADGPEEHFRLIPAQAREGMVLAPKIQSSSDYLMVEQWEDIGTVMRWPTGLRIDTSSFGRLAYRSEVGLSIQRIDRAGLNAARDSGLVTVLPQLAEILPLLENNRLSPPFVELSEQGVFAHADSTLRLPTGTARGLEFTFGMRPGDYAAFPDSDGVCFTISVEGQAGTIFERCLNPKLSAEEAEQQTANIRIPPASVLELKTLSRTSAAYDWSYWGSVKLTDPDNR
jgi:hypothetical protein